MIVSELAKSPSSQLRRSFVLFCQVCLTVLPFSLFKAHFFESFILLAKDPTNEIKMAFLKCVVHNRPYFEKEVDLILKLNANLSTLLMSENKHIQVEADRTDQ